MAQLALSAVRAAKQELRKALRPALANMTERQRRGESEILVRKVGRRLLDQAPGEIGRIQRQGNYDKLVITPLYACMQLLASEEYQSSKRVSVYLSMPTEVDTEPVLKVRWCYIPAPFFSLGPPYCVLSILFHCRTYSAVGG